MRTDIRRQILAEMARQGMTQAELARRAGVRPGWLSRWVHGGHDASQKNAEKMMDALGLELAAKPPK